MQVHKYVACCVSFLLQLYEFPAVRTNEMGEINWTSDQWMRDRNDSKLSNIVTNAHNTSTMAIFIDCGEVSVTYILITVNILLVLTGSSNNCLVALVVWKNKQMQNSTNLLLANSAIAEMLFLIGFGANFFLVHYMEARSLLVVLVLASYLVTATNLALLSIERYNALCNPMKIRRRLGKRGAKFCILIMWSVAIILAIPVAANVMIEKGYIFFCLILAGFTATHGTTIIYCYGRIIYGIYISKTIFNQTCSATISESLKAKKNVVKMVLSITLNFLVAKFPISAYAGILLVTGTKYDSKITCLVLFIETLGLVSAFINPIIYLVFNLNYRNGAKRLFNCGVRNTRVAGHHGNST